MTWDEWIGIVADIIGVFGAGFALFAWRKAYQIRQDLEQEKSRQARKVTVVLQYGADKVELPVELRRAELTRAEILGRIGMIPMKTKGQRFSLSYLNTPEFLRQLNQTIVGDGDVILTIPCERHELEQFDVRR